MLKLVRPKRTEMAEMLSKRSSKDALEILVAALLMCSRIGHV